MTSVKTISVTSEFFLTRVCIMLLSWDKHASAKHVDQQIHAALFFSFGSFCFSELSIFKITLSP